MKSVSGSSAAARSRQVLSRSVLVFGLGATLLSLAGAAHAELSVGDAAPDFTLQASDGNEYTLADFKGKQAVVVAWYPKSFTGG